MTSIIKNKELPIGYICKACGSGLHSIHDCPKKLKKVSKETNTAGNDVGMESSHNNIKQEKTRKIYISGLPYDTTKASLKDLLGSDEANPCFIQHIQLVCFQDNSSKCNGQAFVTCKDESSVTNALVLNGKEVRKKILKVQKVKVDKSQSSSSNGGSSIQNANKASMKTTRCYRCGGDHDPNTCYNPRICYRCKSSEHISTQCPLKKNKV